MKVTLLKDAYLNNATHMTGETVDVDDLDLIALLVDRGTVIGADGKTPPPAPVQPTEEAPVTDIPLVVEAIGTPDMPTPLEDLQAPLKNEGVQPTPAQVSKTIEVLEQDTMPDVHIS